LIIGLGVIALLLGLSMRAAPEVEPATVPAPVATTTAAAGPMTVDDHHIRDMPYDAEPTPHSAAEAMEDENS